MARKQKIELTWIGKKNRTRLELRILPEAPEESCRVPLGAAPTVFSTICCVVGKPSYADVSHA